MLEVWRNTLYILLRANISEAINRHFSGYMIKNA